MIVRRHAPDRPSPIVPEIGSLLSQWGAQVEWIYPEETLVDLETLRADSDLYVLKSKTPTALSYAGALDAAGARLLNSYEATLRMKDKIAVTRALQAAGIPTPETWIASGLHELEPLLKDGPLVVKPHLGSGGEGIEVLRDARDLERIAPRPAPLLVQRYYEPDGRDRKVYCIGEQIFGVERVFPARSLEEKLGRPFTLDPVLRGITQACGQALGLDLFGVDIILSHNRPFVVDASSFPGFKGVPDAALRLADYIYSRCQVFNTEKTMGAA
jgi:ribosomal protein S6--L-glutamate ligase